MFCSGATLHRTRFTQAGRILISDLAAARQWIVAFDGTTFEPAVPLRPDLAFDVRPRLVRVCSDDYILHATRSPDAPAGSGPLVLEPLSAFWPGN